MNKKYKHRYKAIMLDVDGTLVTNEYNGKISKKVKETIIKANEKINIGIASGRPLERLTGIFDELKLKKPCVVNGGAQIVNPVTRSILWERSISPKDITNITAIMYKLNNKIWVVENNKERLFSKNLSIKKPLSFFIPRIQEEKANAIIRKLSPIQTLALTKVVAYHEGCVALHITHSQATKKHAIRKVTQILQMNKKEIIGVGDGYNDFPLFMACGLKVAIGNAITDLKKIADYIAPSVYDDGVAHVIEKFIFQPYLSNPLDHFTAYK